MMYDGARDISHACEYALKTLFSVYNRFKGRADISDADLDKGEPVSINAFIRKVEELWNDSIEDLLSFIMKEWILDQNERVAFGKMLQGRDGYIFERVDNKYRNADRMPGAVFQGIRLQNLYQIIKDLDYIE